MTILVALLLLNAILHAVIVLRFGARENMPPLVFGVIYVVLVVALLAGVPYALWAALVVPVLGLIGLSAAYGRIAHERTVEKIILALLVVIILYVFWLLYAGSHMAAAA